MPVRIGAGAIVTHSHCLQHTYTSRHLHTTKYIFLPLLKISHIVPQGDGCRRPLVAVQLEGDIGICACPSEVRGEDTYIPGGFVSEGVGCGRWVELSLHAAIPSVRTEPVVTGEVPALATGLTLDPHLT